MNDQPMHAALHERTRTLPYGPPPSSPEPDLIPDPALRRLHLNESPFPPSPRVVEAVIAAARNGGLYPDHGCTALAARLGRMNGVPAERMSFGNGSGELLLAAALATVGPGDEAVFPTPTFQTCARGVDIAGARRIDVPVRQNGAADVEAMAAAITPRTRLVYVCSPNNPTGGPLKRAELARLARAVPADVLLLVDEAYFEFGVYAGGPDALEVMREREGAWVVTRTLSKAYSLAGFRVGYALTSDRVIAEALWKLRASFVIGRAALGAACAAIDDVEYHRMIVREVSAERERLAAGLRELGFEVLPSATNFLSALPSSVPASALAAALKREGLLTQAMPWGGANGALRISIGSAADTDAVLRHLQKALAAAV